MILDIQKRFNQYLDFDMAIISALSLIQRLIIINDNKDQISKEHEEKLKSSIEKMFKLQMVDDMAIDKYFNGLFLYNIVQNVETTINDILKVYLLNYPYKIKNCNFTLNELLKSSKDEIVEKSIDKYLNEIFYFKPEDYIKQIYEIFSLENIKDSIIEEYCEIKARRDIGIHNNWYTNEQYLKKSNQKYFSNKNELAIPSIEYLYNAHLATQSLIDDLLQKIYLKYKE